MLIDTHLHLSEKSNEEIDAIIDRAIKNDVGFLILGGTNVTDNKRNLEIASSRQNVFCEIGYHPSEVLDISDDDILLLDKLVFNDNVVAIGEIGLDYHYGKDDKELQVKMFEKQLDIAQKYDLPVVIHSRDATYETISILKKYNLKGVIHCFSGSLETAIEYINMGYYLGIGGVLTFKNSNLKNVISNINLDNIVLETDSPFLSPFRGMENEPKNIKVIAEFLADLKGLSYDDVLNITTRNAYTLFDLSNKI